MSRTNSRTIRAIVTSSPRSSDLESSAETCGSTVVSHPSKEPEFEELADAGPSLKLALLGKVLGFFAGAAWICT